MSGIKTLQGKIDSLSVVQRTFVFLSILFLLYVTWYFLFMRPLSLKRQDLADMLSQKTSVQQIYSEQIQKLAAKKRGDPNLERRQRLEHLQTRLEEVQTAISSSTTKLLVPADMADVLRNVLFDNEGIELLAVEKLKVSPLSSESHRLDSGGNGAFAYKHGMRITFKGDYMSTLAYIKQLEQLEWSFFWDSLSLEVQEYPNARVNITIFTLSTSEHWIGV